MFITGGAWLWLQTDHQNAVDRWVKLFQRQKVILNGNGRHAPARPVAAAAPPVPCGVGR